MGLDLRVTGCLNSPVNLPFLGLMETENLRTAEPGSGTNMLLAIDAWISNGSGRSPPESITVARRDFGAPSTIGASKAAAGDRSLGDSYRDPTIARSIPPGHPAGFCARFGSAGLNQMISPATGSVTC